jgi:hypothetical protein
MRNNVTFRYPAEFISVSEGADILATSGANWFVAWLRRIDGVLQDATLPWESD